MCVHLLSFSLSLHQSGQVHASTSGAFPSLTIHQLCVFFILIRNISFTHHSSALFSSLTIHQLCVFFILIRNILFTHHSSALFSSLTIHQLCSLHSPFISSVSSSSSSGIFSSLAIHQLCIFFIFSLVLRIQCEVTDVHFSKVVVLHSKLSTSC